MTMEFNDREIINFNNLPFFFTALEIPHNYEGLPDVLPFSLVVDKKTGLVSQVGNDNLRDCLEKAYCYGSEITGMMDESGIGKEYAKDFLKFCLSKIDVNKIHLLRILEIGSGTGYFLNLLHENGAKFLTGIEPGKHGIKNSNKWGEINIIQKFFPCDEIVGQKFDLIIASNVIEHIENLDEFLYNIRNYLSKDGSFLISVPDCGEYIDEGNISMLIHEHYSYFTNLSLHNTLANIFINNSIQIQKSDFGGALYAAVSPGEQPSLIKTVDNIPCQLESKILDHIGKIKELILESQKKGVVGIYVPNRVMNVIYLIRNEIDLTKIRFFDDNLQCIDKYLPGINIVIESGKNIVNKTPETIVIASKTFFERIRDKIYSITKEIPEIFSC